MRVMCSLLGVPETDLDAFIAWGDALSPTFGLMDEVQQVAASTRDRRAARLSRRMIEASGRSTGHDDVAATC